MVESVYDYERMSSGSGLSSIGLSGVQHVDAQGAVLASHGYTYDDAGLVDTYTNDDGQAAYSYDATGQLIDADYDYQEDEAFNYDLNGNRLEYIVGVNNQVLSDGLYWYEYDEEGARTEKYQWSDLDADGLVDEDERFDVTSYTWDARGRLTKITTKPDGQITTRVVQYAYDYLNRRVEKKIDDGANPKTAERYTYLGHDIVLQANKQGDLTHRYLHGPAVDQCLADENVFDDNVLYPLFDNLGSVRDLADHDPSTGETTIVNHILYDAFGRIVHQTDPTQTTIYGHTGRETDAESNLIYHRRRYYDAALGQFVSEDPIGFAAGDANLYRYVGNGPTNAIDPSGLQPPDSVMEHQRLGINPGYYNQYYGDGGGRGIFLRLWDACQPAPLPTPPFPSTGSKVGSHVPNPDYNRIPSDDHKGRPGFMAEARSSITAILIPEDRIDSLRDYVRDYGVTGGERGMYAPLKEGEIAGTTGCATCVGVVIVTPDGNVAVYHFSAMGDPRLDISQYKWPDGSKAAIAGGSPAANSRQTYDWAVDALRDAGIELQGISNYNEIYWANLDGKEGWALPQSPDPPCD